MLAGAANEDNFVVTGHWPCFKSVKATYAKTHFKRR